MLLRKSWIALIPAVLCVAMLAACTPVQNGNASTTSIPKPVDISGSNVQSVAFKPVDMLQPEVADALSSFSLDLFQRVEAADSGKNVFISPLSVWLALGMAYNGASGSTAQGMAKALHASGISLDDLNKSNSGLMGVLSSADTDAHIAVANSLWLNKSFDKSIKKGFLDTDTKYYAAPIQSLVFSAPGAADTMNSWVKQQTGGRITGLVASPIDAETELFLVNAVSFEAPWRQPFNPDATRDGEFSLADGSTVHAKFMTNGMGAIKTGYAGSDACAVRLPYASGRLEMFAVMPRQQSFKEFLNGLTPETLQKYTDMCSETDMELQFPKFSAAFSTKLNDALSAMGMGEAFSANAKFDAMSSLPSSISNVIHKACIDVDEKGTKAWSAGSVDMVAGVAFDNLDFNRPFVYLIRDTKTGAILFIGAMENPS